MKQRTADWFGLALGAWMFLSPWFLDFSAAPYAAWNAWIVGAAVVLFFAIALAYPRAWEEWVNIVLAVWLFIAPFALGFTDLGAAAWNHWILAVLIAGDALWAMSQPRPEERFNTRG